MKIFLFYSLLLLYNINLKAQKSDTILVAHWQNGKPKEIKITQQGSYIIQKFYSSGGLQCSISYNKEDKLDGPEICYYEDGSIKQEYNWKNGINYGKFTLYYRSGQKSFEGAYLEDGSPHGLWKGFYENGQIQYEQSYQHGMKHGKWANYSSDGGLESLEYFENGVLKNKTK